jgi:hypothetical protein
VCASLCVCARVLSVLACVYIGVLACVLVLRVFCVRYLWGNSFTGTVPSSLCASMDVWYGTIFPDNSFTCPFPAECEATLLYYLVRLCAAFVSAVAGAGGLVGQWVGVFAAATARMSESVVRVLCASVVLVCLCLFLCVRVFACVWVCRCDCGLCLSVLCLLGVCARGSAR